MKKGIYIFLFSILGLLLGFLLHAIVEIIYIRLLINNYETFGFGLDFSVWFTIHKVWAIITLLGGLWFGYYQGKKWWRVLYVERKYSRWFRTPLKPNF